MSGIRRTQADVVNDCETVRENLWSDDSPEAIAALERIRADLERLYAEMKALDYNDCLDPNVCCVHAGEQE